LPAIAAVNSLPHCYPDRYSLNCYQNLIGNTESALGPEWTKNLKAGKRQEALFTAEGKPTVQVMLDSAPLETYVLILPPDAPKGGFVGRIPTMEEFVHP